MFNRQLWLMAKLDISSNCVRLYDNKVIFEPSLSCVGRFYPTTCVYRVPIQHNVCCFGAQSGERDSILRREAIPGINVVKWTTTRTPNDRSSTIRASSPA